MGLFHEVGPNRAALTVELWLKAPPAPSQAAEARGRASDEEDDERPLPFSEPQTLLRRCLSLPVSRAEVEALQEVEVWALRLCPDGALEIALAREDAGAAAAAVGGAAGREGLARAGTSTRTCAAGVVKAGKWTHVAVTLSTKTQPGQGASSWGSRKEGQPWRQVVEVSLLVNGKPEEVEEFHVRTLESSALKLTKSPTLGPEQNLLPVARFGVWETCPPLFWLGAGISERGGCRVFALGKKGRWITCPGPRGGGPQPCPRLPRDRATVLGLRAKGEHSTHKNVTFVTTSKRTGGGLVWVGGG